MISQGNHVKFAHFVFLAVSEEAQTSFFCFVQCIIKQLLDSVSVISKIIKVSVRVISLSYQPSASADNPYLTLIILDITKTSSNNCLLVTGYLLLHTYVNCTSITRFSAASRLMFPALVLKT